jgi:putative ABC transport system permease protein
MGSGLLSSVAPYVHSSFEASLIPAIDSLRSLAIVWIPGLMAGMLLSGARPAYAAIYQFVVLAMIFASSGFNVKHFAQAHPRAVTSGTVGSSPRELRK